MSEYYQQVHGEIKTDKFDVVNHHVGSLKVGFEFHNASDHTFYICFRDGTISEVMPSKGLPRTGNIIVAYNVRNDSGGDIFTVNGDESIRLKKIKSSMTNKGFYYEELLPSINIIHSRNGSYHGGSDTFITHRMDIAQLIGHPYSEQNILNWGLVEDKDFMADTDISVSIRYVNNGISARLYTVINGNVAVVKSKRNLSLANGIYLTGLPMLSGDDNAMRRSEHFSVNDCLEGNAPIKFYLTCEQAQAALVETNVKYNAEQNKILQAKHELEMAGVLREKEAMRVHNDNVEHERRKEVLLREQENLQLKQLLETSLLRSKADLETHTITNKKSYEKIKTIGLTATALLAVLKIVTMF